MSPANSWRMRSGSPTMGDCRDGYSAVVSGPGVADRQTPAPRIQSHTEADSDGGSRPLTSASCRSRAANVRKSSNMSALPASPCSLGSCSRFHAETTRQDRSISLTMRSDKALISAGETGMKRSTSVLTTSAYPIRDHCQAILGTQRGFHVSQNDKAQGVVSESAGNTHLATQHSTSQDALQGPCMHRNACGVARSDPRVADSAPAQCTEKILATGASPAIRRMCMECAGGMAEVQRCSAGPGHQVSIAMPPCTLYRFRLGSAARVGRGGRLRAIRQHCLLCMGGHQQSSRYVLECSCVGCALHPYRMGKRPKRGGAQ